MKENEKIPFEDDNCVVEDMSDIELQPILIPKFGGLRKGKNKAAQTQIPSQLDSEEKRAFIGGALVAGLAVGLLIALAFAALILLISHMG